MHIYIFVGHYSVTYISSSCKALYRVVTPSSTTTNMWSFDSPILDPAIHLNTLLAPFESSYVIGSKKCTPWEDVSLRFGNGLKGLNVDCPGGHRPMERDGVCLNQTRATKTTFDGNGDAGWDC
jgi:hypothetical protein